MSKYVKIYPDFFENNSIDEILSLRMNHSEILSDLIIDSKTVPIQWRDLFFKIEKRGLELIHDYMKDFYSLFPISGLSLNHIGFLDDDLGSFTELHYDWEMIEVNKDLIIKPLVLLVYLNTSDLGGELFFPLEDLKIKPIKGRAVIFPSSFTFPHLSLPLLKGEKHLMRLTYRMDNEYYKSRKIEL